MRERQSRSCAPSATLLPRRPCARGSAFTATLALITLTLTACAPADDDPLEVRAPRAGAVYLGDRYAPVAPLAPARFPEAGPGPHTVTYADADGALTLVDVAGPVVDLAALIDARPTVRGPVYPLRVRPTPGARLVAVSDGQLFTPTLTGEVATFLLPDAPTTLVALWTDPPRLTRRPVPSPRREAGVELPLDPRTPLTAELLVALAAAPAGRITAELTEQGLRTGLVLADGIADPTTAVVVPRPPDPAEPSGLWITAIDQSSGEAPRRAVSVAAPLDRDGVLLEWPAPPAIDPPPRDAARALPLDPAAGWSLTGADDASWIEVAVEGRGACVDSRQRVVFPPGAPLVLPEAQGPDPFDAPVVHARVTAVHQTGATLAELLEAGPAPAELPRWAARRATAAVEGDFESGTEACDPPPLRGLYAVFAPGDTCDPAVAAPRAVITRCGHLVMLDGDAASPVGCGRFTGDDPLRFETRGAASLPIARDGDRLAIPTGEGAVRLVPVPPPTATEPPDAAGDYTRFTLARQPLDADGRATAEPAVIDGGPAPAGPAATFDRGTLRVRTRHWSFDARLVDGDNEAATARADTGGCAARPEALRITWSPGAVFIEGDGAGRRYLLTLRR